MSREQAKKFVIRLAIEKETRHFRLKIIAPQNILSPLSYWAGDMVYENIIAKDRLQSLMALFTASGILLIAISSMPALGLGSQYYAVLPMAFMLFLALIIPFLIFFLEFSQAALLKRYMNLWAQGKAKNRYLAYFKTMEEIEEKLEEIGIENSKDIVGQFSKKKSKPKEFAGKDGKLYLLRKCGRKEYGLSQVEDTRKGKTLEWTPTNLAIIHAIRFEGYASSNAQAFANLIGIPHPTARDALKDMTEVGLLEKTGNYSDSQKYVFSEIEFEAYKKDGNRLEYMPLTKQDQEKLRHLFKVLCFLAI